MTRVLVVANDFVGSRMAGPAIRSWEFARHLADRCDVTLAVPAPTDLRSDRFAVVVAPAGERQLLRLAASFDAVVAQWLPPSVMTRLAETPTKVVYDLYDPVLLENLALDVADEEAKRVALNVRATNLAQRIALVAGDAFVCASEKQRDLWLGSLAALGRVDAAAYARDPSLRSLVDVVPFGVPAEPPAAQEPALKGVIPGIRDTDRVLLWGGGIWDWLDPLTVIRAVVEVARVRDDVRLYFLGIRNPNPLLHEMPMARRAVALADELGVRDRIVFFNEGWVAYERRAQYLLEADVGVSAHFDHVEARFAFRTRLLDCFWTGLPVVTTEGDELAELVHDRRLGKVVPFEDVSAWKDALLELLADDGARTRIAAAGARVRDELAWPRVLEPLAALVESPAAATPRGGARLALAEHYVLRARLAVGKRGVVGAGRAALRRLGRGADGVA